MLENTFIHVPGVGELTEARLWAAGIYTWRDLLGASGDLPVRLRNPAQVRRHIEQSQYAIERSDHRFFAKWLPAREHWRSYPEFRHRTAFLDIETTGLGPDSLVTVIGLHDADRYKVFIRGENMEEFPDEIGAYGLLVTFNGATFDLPFLRRAFRGLKMDQLHVDLRYALGRLGYGGGLKAIERQLNIRRSPQTQHLDGFDAVRLWYEYERGNDDSLRLLVQYNSEDVTNLRGLMELTYESLYRHCFGRHRGAGPEAVTYAGFREHRRA